MTVIQAVVLGVLQGLAEFLPISSSAHLALAPWAFGWPDPGLAFDVALHVGTLAAVLTFFRREWARLVAAGWGIMRTRRVETEDQRRAVQLVIASIPAGVAGVALRKYAETVFRTPVVIATALIAMGTLLWLVDRFAAQRRTLDSMGALDALLVGLAQVFALIPGFSRSGTTISAGRALRFDRESAAVFSFLMSMPIIAASAAFELPHALRAEGLSAPLALGIVVSGVSGWLAIKIMLRFVSRHSYGVFAAYRLVLGAAVFALVASRG